MSTGLSTTAGSPTHTLSVVIPCFNESATLQRCVESVLSIADESLRLQIIIVDDASTDKSVDIAGRLAEQFDEISLKVHPVNRGKGAALRTGFSSATGDMVAVQDADLEYDPADLKRLVVPIIEGNADVVLGSRFIGDRPHRVLLFWHTMGNRFLTMLSNMMTDMNLTDMETCYKVFRRDIIADIEIEEDRFGFEPEVVAKIADRRLRVYEMGIAYRGRSYEEGKKIGLRDGFRALYCILHYNGHRTSLVVQAAIYSVVGGVAAAINFVVFAILLAAGSSAAVSASLAFIIAAIINYFLCIATIFRHRSRWGRVSEIAVYALLVAIAGTIDVGITTGLVNEQYNPHLSKILATAATLAVNFFGRRHLVFRSQSRKRW